MLDYMSTEEPIRRKYHHDQLTFGMLYAFTESSPYLFPTTKWFTEKAP